jgi:hypothetical protein
VLQHPGPVFDRALGEHVDRPSWTVEGAWPRLGLGLGLGPTEVASESVRGEVDDIEASVHVIQCYRRV